MRRLFQTIIIILFSTFLTIDSFAFISAITKGAKAISKLKGAAQGSKVGATSIPSSGIDEVASGAFNIKKIDFMNIDIEGSEYDVLKTLNFKDFHIKVICIEIVNYDCFITVKYSS